MTDNENKNPHQAVADLVEGADAAFFASSDAPPPPVGGESDPTCRHESDDGDSFAGEDEPAPEMPEEERARLNMAIIAECAGEPQNDTGNGQRLLRHFGDQLLNVREAAGGREAGWHHWIGSHWQREGGNEAAGLCAQRTAPRIALEADYLTATPSEQRAIDEGVAAERDLKAMEKRKPEWGEEDQAKASALERLIDVADEAIAQVRKRQVNRRKFAVSSGNSARVRAMLEMALPHRTIAQEQLDADPYAFNVENGTVRFECYEVEDLECPDAEAVRKKDFWAARLDPHDPADLISKIAPANFIPDAEAPIFRASIARFQPNENVRRWLQKYFGYSLLGVNGEQCMLFNYGAGANWKSTAVEIISRVMGDYAMTLKFESLAGDGQTTGAQASPDIARLPGARLVRASEPDRGVSLKEGLIKSITGGEPMLARHNFGNFFSFYPVFKMVLAGNHKPEIGGADHGIWRRVRFVIWPVTIGDDERREFDEVIAELWAERAGILAWLVDGALLYLTEGLAPPQEIIDSTEEYREEMDCVGGFARDCIESVTIAGASDPPTVPAREVYDAFVAWCEANAVRPWREKSFAAAMSQKGFAKERNMQGRRYVGVRLKNVPARGKRGRSDEPPHPAEGESEEIPA